MAAAAAVAAGFAAAAAAAQADVHAVLTVCGIINVRIGDAVVARWNVHDHGQRLCERDVIGQARGGRHKALVGAVELKGVPTRAREEG